jgi:Imidazoleglycerol-phosphate dehydratase
MCAPTSQSAACGCAVLLEQLAAFKGPITQTPSETDCKAHWYVSACRLDKAALLAVQQQSPHTGLAGRKRTSSSSQHTEQLTSARCLQQIASHGLLDIEVNAQGDTWIDDHHTVEDIALAFGGALSQALGDRKGIFRFGDFHAPLDEALVHVVLVRPAHLTVPRQRSAPALLRTHVAHVTTSPLPLVSLVRTGMHATASSWSCGASQVQQCLST